MSDGLRWLASQVGHCLRCSRAVVPRVWTWRVSCVSAISSCFGEVAGVKGAQFEELPGGPTGWGLFGGATGES